MGMEILVATEGECPLAAVLAKLGAAGVGCTLLMVDNQLASPRAAPPVAWRDARLKTPAGTVTLARRAAGIAVVVFGNADPSLVAMQRRIAEVLGTS